MKIIKKISLKKINFLLAFVVALLLIQIPFTTTTPTTNAGGPLANCASGIPYTWAGGGVNIPFNPDQGNLGPVNNAAATALVQQAFDVWGAVPTSTASYTNAGTLPVDVDITNFDPYLNATAPDGLSAIVFDDDGQIFDLLFGPGSGILGFAGPEWGTPATCTIDEGYSFLNGPSFTNGTAALDVMVHEFGHYTNLAHTIVNGQIYLGSVGGDNSGPSPNNTFTPIPDPFTDVIETMYPFYYGPGIGTQTLEKDDIASLSTLYPAPGFATMTGAISGTIYAPNGTTKVTGVNVIARNIANPFDDAVSAISSDFTDDFSQGDPVTGTYKIEGLTPGANYAVYVDEILAGGFSTPPASPLPGPEEFYNGANESNNITSPDDASVFTPVPVSAGNTTTGVDIIFNTPGPGDPLGVGDDGSVEVFLPFTFEICQQSFDSVFVNANGNLTFGAANGDFSETAGEMLSGPPRIAGLWDDLNPSAAGTVFYTVSPDDITFHWDSVPEWLNTGSNTFSISLKRPLSRPTRTSGFHNRRGTERKSDVDVMYGTLTATDGLGGVSCGVAKTSGFEPAVDLTSFVNPPVIDLTNQAAVYEVWNASNPTDVANNLIRYYVKTDYADQFENNNTLGSASFVDLPFNSAPIHKYTEISPTGNDVDYFSFRQKSGKTLIAEIQTGGLDSVIGLYDPSGTLVAVDDDGGTGLLSRIVYPVPTDGLYTVAVSTFPDFDFTGDGGSGGRYVLDLRTIDGTLLNLGDDNSQEVPLGFTFPFNGNNYTSVFVNSNGNLTFGSGDTDFSESVAELLSDQPRIAPLWDDLSPNAAGLVTAEFGPGTATIKFDSVPEFVSTGANTFSVKLYSSGRIDVNYGSISAIDGLAGVSPGGGAANPGGTNLSAASTYPAMGVTYELFNAGNPNDLSGLNLSYLP